MLYLFFDTETTGFPIDRLTPAHPTQPHCVQLAALLTNEEGQELACMNVVIAPDGWEIPEQAARIHGLTTAQAQKLGVQEETACHLFGQLAARAELLVAHNITFDLKILNIMAHRYGAPHISGEQGGFCTMKGAELLVDLPPTERMLAAGRTGPKPPKLEEAYKHFFNEPLEGAHDALVDVRACKRLFFRLRELGVGA